MSIRNQLLTILLIVLLASIFVPCTEAMQAGWSKVYPGSAFPCGDIIQTNDGGYALTGLNANKTAAYIAKLDSAGDVQWSNTYGNDTVSNCIVQTSDNGYAIAGWTFASAWLARTDSSGKLLWSQTYSLDLLANSLVQTSDGGFAFVGESTHSNAFCLIKTDSAGNEQWAKLYDTSYENIVYQMGTCLINTNDGGFAFVGQVQYKDAGSTFTDIWLFKIDSSGNMQWNSTFGRQGSDTACCIIQLQNQDFLIAGYAGSYGSIPSDALLIKTNSNGAMLWNKTYGGTKANEINAVIETDDGGCALAGSTSSYGAGGLDMWLIKTDSNGNPQWNQTFGGAQNDGAISVFQTSDGGYLVGGYTESNGYKDNFWLIQTNQSGELPEFPFIVSTMLVISLTTCIVIIVHLAKKTNSAHKKETRLKFKP